MKIYKLECNGKFYIGSTSLELRERLQAHKDKSKEYPNRKLYKHITDWNDVSMILLEEFDGTKQELVLKENEYIQKELSNPLCLNTNCAVITISRTEYFKMYRQLERIKDYQRKYQKEYRAKKLILHNTL